MRQRQSWEITDEFREAIKHLILVKGRDKVKEYKRKPGGGRKPIEPRKALEAIFYVLRTGIQRKALLKEFGRQVQSIVIFNFGVNKVSLKRYGLPIWSDMMKYKV